METIFVPPLLVQLGLTYEQPTETSRVSKGGIRLTAYGRHGLPYRRSRVIVLYLADKAREDGNRVTGTLTDIREHFALDWHKSNLLTCFLRVVECRYEVRVDSLVCSCSDCHAYQTLPFILSHQYCPETQAFSVELSDEFVDSVRRGVCCSRRVVLNFMHAKQLVALDLYVWLAWRLQRGDHRTVPLCGPDGPSDLIAGSRYETRMRQSMRQNMETVLAVWPECPFRLLDKRRPRIAHIDSLTEQVDALAAPPSNDQTSSPAIVLPSNIGSRHLPNSIDLRGASDMSKAIGELSERVAKSESIREPDDADSDQTV